MRFVITNLFNGFTKYMFPKKTIDEKVRASITKKLSTYEVNCDDDETSVFVSSDITSGIEVKLIRCDAVEFDETLDYINNALSNSNRNSTGRDDALFKRGFS